MVKRNPHFSRLKPHYLFQEIARRKQQFMLRYPNVSLLSLGIGDTTEPIPRVIANSMANAANGLGTKEGYRGYGPEQGMGELREEIAEKWYQGNVKAREVFISDGAKCDIGRLQQLFGSKVTIAVQDPAYPVYVDSSLIAGQMANEDIVFMPCLPTNDFFPDLSNLPSTDLIFVCSPNNPTGAVATREQLKQLVAFATANRSIIIFDAAYASFIHDSALPKSIFEIEGARKVAIEVNSFSKIAGFTGIRLGWTVVPDELEFEDGSSVQADWARLMGTIFNGASCIAQMGGLAILDKEGMIELEKITFHYLENAQIIRKAFMEKGFAVYGGKHAPYVWVEFPGMKSWEVFQYLLEKIHLVATPGSGFGPMGEGFMRFSAFGSRKMIEDAAKAILLHLSAKEPLKL